MVGVRVSWVFGFVAVLCAAAPAQSETVTVQGTQPQAAPAVCPSTVQAKADGRARIGHADWTQQGSDTCGISPEMRDGMTIYMTDPQDDAAHEARLPDIKNAIPS